MIVIACSLLLLVFMLWQFTEVILRDIPEIPPSGRDFGGYGAYDQKYYRD